MFNRICPHCDVNIPIWKAYIPRQGTYLKCPACDVELHAAVAWQGHIITGITAFVATVFALYLISTDLSNVPILTVMAILVVALAVQITAITIYASYKQVPPEEMEKDPLGRSALAVSVTAVMLVPFSILIQEIQGFVVGVASILLALTGIVLGWRGERIAAARELSHGAYLRLAAWRSIGIGFLVIMIYLALAFAPDISPLIVS